MNDVARTLPIGVPGVLPRSETFVPRDRVNRLLTQASTRPLTIVTGPGGVGKSLAVADWVDRGPAAAIWVSLIESVRTPEAIWAKCMDALRARLGIEALDGITVPQLMEASTLEAIAHRAGGRLVVVLDNFGRMDDAAGLAAIDTVLRAPPRGVHLVLISRHDPALSLHRLRLRGQLAEVRFSDLAFTLDEARALLKRWDVVLSDAAVGRLLAATGGWAAALHLAALSLRDADDPERVLDRFDGGNLLVSDYLWDEVLGILPPDVNDLLMRTSVSSHLCGSLARALSGNPDADAILRRLARDELLVEDHERPGWFTSHSLLQRMLHSRLVGADADLETELQRVAVDWFERHGDGLEALTHAIATRDWDFVGQVATRSGAPVLFMGDRAGVATVLATIPPASAHDHPEVAAALAFRSYIVGDPAGVATMAQFAEAKLASLPAGRRDLATVTLRVAQSAQSHRGGDSPAALAASIEAETILSRLSESEAHAWAIARPAVAGIRATAELWSGNVEGASTLMSSVAVQAPDTIRRGYQGTYFLGIWALAEALRGVAIPSSRARALEALDIARDAGRLHVHESQYAWLALTVAELSRGDVAAARAGLEGCREAGAAGLNANLVTASRLLGARVDLASGDLASARRTLADVGTRLARREGVSLMARVATDASVDLELAAGAPDRARAVLAAHDAAMPASRDLVAISRARVLLASASAEQAMACVAHLLDRHGAVASNAWMIVSQAEDHLRHDARAIEAFARALDEAEEQEFLLPFVQPQRWLTTALRRHSYVVGTHHDFIERALALTTGARGVPDVTDAVVAPSVLTERELAVIAYLPTMSSNTEIADQLSISVNTVKQHLKSAYRKLGVTTRRDAVRVAREKGLLPT